MKYITHTQVPHLPVHVNPLEKSLQEVDKCLTVLPCALQIGRDEHHQLGEAQVNYIQLDSHRQAEHTFRSITKWTLDQPELTLGDQSNNDSSRFEGVQPPQKECKLPVQ